MENLKQQIQDLIEMERRSGSKEMLGRLNLCLTMNG